MSNPTLTPAQARVINELIGAFPASVSYTGRVTHALFRLKGLGLITLSTTIGGHGPGLTVKVTHTATAILP